MKNDFQWLNIMKNDYDHPQIPSPRAAGVSRVRFPGTRLGELFKLAGLSCSAKRDNRMNKANTAGETTEFSVGQSRTEGTPNIDETATWWPRDGDPNGSRLSMGHLPCGRQSAVRDGSCWLSINES